MLSAQKMSSETFFLALREQLLSESLKALARRKTLHGLCSIYRGREADVYKLVYPGRKPEAAKITTCDRPDDGNAFWPALRHKNILRMLDAFTLTVLDDIPVRVHLMPYKERTLAAMIGAQSFGLHPGDYPRVKQWLRQVLSGLKYLHAEGLCHLNVTVDNVVLTSKSRAQLCDFDSLRKVGDPIERSAVGLPCQFHPPEAEVTGFETDLWSFGLLVIDCLTKLSLRTNGEPTTPKEHSWESDVLPRLRQILQPDEFSRLIRRSHPASDIPDKDLLRALDFVHGFLQTDPAKRTPAARAKQHPAVGGTKRKGYLCTPDPIWTEDSQDTLPCEPPLETEPAVTDADENEQTGTNSMEVVPAQTITPEESPAEPIGENQLNDQEVAQLVQFLNRIFEKATQELECRGLKPDESELSTNNNEENLETPPEGSTAQPVPIQNLEAVLRAHGIPDEISPEPISHSDQQVEEEPAERPERRQPRSGSAEVFKEPSYFNLKSLSLSSRFNSSSDGSADGPRFQWLRRGLSRAASFFSRKASP